MAGLIRVGTAGWSIPRAMGASFHTEGTHLQRYARAMTCAEINSSFHRPHSARTYARWAAATPPGFLFSVKVPRSITHTLKLRRARLPLERFLDESAGLGDRRGPLLLQLPPSFAFDRAVAARFLALLRSRHHGDVVCEPRHASWFTADADRLLVDHRVGRVAADPALHPDASRPGGWPGLVYVRLHGSPRTYWSRYEEAFIATIADVLRAGSAGREAWCVFDNTASGAALDNAVQLQQRLAGAIPAPVA